MTTKTIERPYGTTFYMSFAFHEVKSAQEWYNVTRGIKKEDIIPLEKIVGQDTFQPAVLLFIRPDNSPVRPYNSYYYVDLLHMVNAEEIDPDMKNYTVMVCDLK